MRRSRLPALVLATALAGAALAGCGDDSTDPDSTASDTASTSPSASPSPSATGTTAPPSADHTFQRKQKLITLAEPAEGAEVSGSFTASGKANSPEANVLWEIRDPSGKVVLDGFATAEGWMDRLYPWSTDIDVSSLEPGAYVFVAMTDDPSGGEGNPPEKVGAAIVVR
jgi:hypothetical protein